MRVLTASVRGPAHQHAKKPNEDACQGKARAGAFWVAVADGMGSRPMASAGSRAAVVAAERSWKLWSARDGSDPADFARLCVVLWRLALPKDVSPADAATTLLFCGGFAERNGLCAQIGDGVLGCRNSSGFEHFSPTKHGFSNQTLGLGGTPQLSDWMLRVIPPVAKGTCYMLASDGVSDDLLPEKTTGMIDWLLRDFGASSQLQGNQSLRNILRAWPVPHHLDDKSLALAWNPAQ